MGSEAVCPCCERDSAGYSDWVCTFHTASPLSQAPLPERRQGLLPFKPPGGLLSDTESASSSGSTTGASHACNGKAQESRDGHDQHPAAIRHEDGGWSPACAPLTRAMALQWEVFSGDPWGRERSCYLCSHRACAAVLVGPLPCSE